MAVQMCAVLTYNFEEIDKLVNVITSGQVHQILKIHTQQQSEIAIFSENSVDFGGGDKKIIHHF